MSTDDLSSRIAAAARSLEHEEGAQLTMERVLELAIEMLPGAEYAGISLVSRRGMLESPATTHEVILEIDRLQVESGQGPCVETIFTEDMVQSRNLADDVRWPDWGPRVVEETGIRSMMCFRLFTQSDTVGTLNLYATELGAFATEDRDHGIALAAHAALAMVAARRVETLNLGLDTRTVIGQATGVLMERFDLDAPSAFDVLKRVSQDSNRKLREIAQELVVTRHLPES